MSAGVPYSQHVRPRTQTIDLARAIFGAQITPLVDVAAPTLHRLPADIAAQVQRDFWKRHNAGDDWETKYAAQEWIATEVAEFEREKIHRAFDEEEIRALAKRWADLCGRMLRLEPMQEFARSVGIAPPEVRKNVTRVGAARRMACVRWWRRQIRKTYLRKAESHLRARGFVHRRRQVYASDRAVEHRRQRKRREETLLRELQAVSDAGDQLELWEVIQASQANPALRRAELMTRLRGFEEVAQAAGHMAEFVTLTCPSAYHRTHDNGTANERWQGFTPRDGQQWLCKQWARARSKLKRLKVNFYGFRIAEPHHDGTPHWHAVFFVASHHGAALRTVLSAVWLSDYGDEPGAKKYRSKFIRIDPAKGSACGYLAKYVAKNIDGFEVGEDHETAGQAAAESCDRVAAWAAAHGIRQFQQIGGPSVSVWRELRRLRAELRGGDHAAIEAARKAADAGEWADFIAALGGVGDCRKRGSVALWTETTGELSQYEELRGPQIAGVQSDRGRGADSGGATCHPRPDKTPGARRAGSQPVTHDTGIVRVRTRCKVWRIQRKKGPGACSGSWDSEMRSAAAGLPVLSSLGPVSITVRGSRNMPADASTSAQGSASNQGVTVDALMQARKRLSSRLADKRLLLVPGLADDLLAIMRAFEELETRTANLAAFALRKHFWPQSEAHTAHLNALMQMGPDAQTVARIAVHGENCLCRQCGVGSG